MLWFFRLLLRGSLLCRGRTDTVPVGDLLRAGHILGLIAGAVSLSQKQPENGKTVFRLLCCGKRRFQAAYSAQRLKISEVLTPPKAKLLFITYSVLMARGLPAM